MTKEKVYELIESAKVALEGGYQKDEFAYNYLRTFLEKNEITRATDIIDIDIKKLLHCLYFLYSDDSLKESIRKVDSIISLFGHNPQKTIMLISVYVGILNDLISKDLLPLAIEYLKEKKKSNARKIHKTLSEQISEDTVLALHAMKTLLNKEITLLFEMFNNEFYAASKIVKVLYFYATIKKDRNAINSTVFKLENLYKKIIDKKSLDRDFKAYTKSLSDYKEFMRDFGVVKDYVRKTEKEENKFYKKKNEEIRGLDTAKKKLERALEQEEITNARDIIKTVESPDVKTAILTLIYSHNMSYYKELDKRYKKIKKDDKGKYLALLDGFQLTEEEIDLIMQNSLNDTKEMLLKLKDLKIEKEKIILILQNSDLVSVNMVIMITKRGFLSSSILNEHYDIFYKSSKKLKRVEKNIETITSFNINPTIFKGKNDWVFLIDENVLRNNLETLQRYNLLNLKSTEDLSFLQEESLVIKIDRIIELGYEKQLEESLEILSISTSKYLEVLKAINITDLDLDISYILSNFFIDDDKLDDYIPGILPYKEKRDLGNDESLLQVFKNSPRTYKIGSTLISQPKVARLLAAGYDLYDSIFYNVFINEDEYNEMISQFTSKVIKK